MHSKWQCILPMHLWFFDRSDITKHHHFQPLNQTDDAWIMYLNKLDRSAKYAFIHKLYMCAPSYVFASLRHLHSFQLLISHTFLFFLVSFNSPDVHPDPHVSVHAPTGTIRCAGEQEPLRLCAQGAVDLSRDPAGIVLWGWGTVGPRQWCWLVHWKKINYIYIYASPHIYIYIHITSPYRPTISNLVYNYGKKKVHISAHISTMNWWDSCSISEAILVKKGSILESPP